MAHSKQISSVIDRSPPANLKSLQPAQVAPLATATLAPSRCYQSAVYHVNSRVLLTRLSTLNAVHRSVPAVDGNALCHRDQYSVLATWSGPKVALPPASTLVPSEYAARFMMRQSAKPNIVGLDSKTILPERTQHRPDKAFLPSVSRCRSRSSSQQDNVSASGSAAGRLTPRKKRNAADSGRQKSPHNDQSPASISVHGVHKVVAPHEQPEQAATSGGDPTGNAGSPSKSNHASQIQAQQLLGTATIPKLDDYLLEPTQDRGDADSNINSVGYISNNTRMTPRENPWVYRYKVKKNMNQINKILTSKSPCSE